MVLTLHTVLSAPSVRQAETLRALCDLATLVCVFTETARRMILDARLVPPERVRVVPHGGPTELLPRPAARRQRTAPRPDAIGADRRVLATFGLISPGKGIEMAIAAMPAIVARHPHALYVIAGQTHPEVAKLHGEEYRISLERLARDLGLDDHVVFDDRFLELEDLSSMLAATTIYLTPYRSREQIVSGALTFAIVAGCPTVSTPYFYAEDLLASGAGVLVPFDDPGRARRGGQRPARRPASGSRARGPRRARSGPSWPGPRSAARPPRCCARPSRSGRRRRPRIRRRRTLPRARASHLLTLVDDVGIVQHADGSRAGACLGLLHRRRRAPGHRRARARARRPARRPTTGCWPGASASCATPGARSSAGCATSCPTTAAGSTNPTAATTSGGRPGRWARSWRPSRFRRCASRA